MCLAFMRGSFMQALQLGLSSVAWLALPRSFTQCGTLNKACWRKSRSAVSITWGSVFQCPDDRRPTF